MKKNIEEACKYNINDIVIINCKKSITTEWFDRLFDGVQATVIHKYDNGIIRLQIDTYVIESNANIKQYLNNSDVNKNSICVSPFILELVQTEPFILF